MSFARSTVTRFENSDNGIPSPTRYFRSPPESLIKMKKATSQPGAGGVGGGRVAAVVGGSNNHSGNNEINRLIAARQADKERIANLEMELAIKNEMLNRMKREREAESRNVNFRQRAMKVDVEVHELDVYYE